MAMVLDWIKILVLLHILAKITLINLNWIFAFPKNFNNKCCPLPQTYTKRSCFLPNVCEAESNM